MRQRECESASQYCEGKAIRGERYCPTCRAVMLQRMADDGYLIDLAGLGIEREDWEALDQQRASGGK